jgi:hypothetical protein
MNLKTFELEMTRLAFLWGLIEIIGFAIGLWLLYLVIKNAIRDGINESRLTDNWNKTASIAKEREAIAKAIPDMRAER